MVTCKYYKKGISINHVWFSEKKGDIELKNAFINFVHGVPQNFILNNGLVRCQYSLITNLTESKEKLYQNIRKNFRYEIRRTNKENVTMRVFSAEDMMQKSDLLQVFANTYNQMYADKGMKDTFNMPLVNAYIRNKSILFTIAYYEQEPLVFHSYIVDGLQCRFFYSTSPFRAEKELANEIGRMNKALHWHDLIWFKEHGFKKYDWGGINNPEVPNGIDNFKFGFGGELVLYNNIICGKNKAVNLLLHIYNKMKNNMEG